MRILLLALVLGTVGGVAPALAHEIPATTTVRAFVRPEGAILRFLVRVPLEAMRDFDFPKRGPGYLDIEAAGPLLRQAATQWIADYVQFDEGTRSIGPPVIAAIRISLPSDPSFRSYPAALGHLQAGPVNLAVDLPWQQALLDILLEYSIDSDSSRFTIDPAFAHLGGRTTTVLHVISLAGTERVLQFQGNPGRVRLDPGWHHAAWRFVVLGFEHILDGLDHILFLLALILPVRRFWSLVPVVTAFTVAHSITLGASALGLAPNALWFPPLVESLIALSVVAMAIANVVGGPVKHRWMIAFGFGLIHGFGFSFALSETLQFAGGHLLTALVSFNVGVEIGQLVVVAILAGVLNYLFRRVVRERVGAMLVSILVGHTAWHWMTDRGGRLVDYRFSWPPFDSALAVSVLRWAALAVIIGGVGWMLRGVFRRLERGHYGRSSGEPDHVA